MVVGNADGVNVNVDDDDCVLPGQLPDRTGLPEHTRCTETFALHFKLIKKHHNDIKTMIVSVEL